MANASLSAWAAKFLIAYINFDTAFSTYNPKTKGSGASLESALKVMFSLRAELVGILGTLNINAGSAATIIKGLDAILNPISGYYKNDGEIRGSLPARPGRPLLIWFNQYIKPLL